MVKDVRDLHVGDRIHIAGSPCAVTAKQYKGKKTWLKLLFDDGSQCAVNLNSRREIVAHRTV